MEGETALTVGTVAGLAGVSIRTLHHYDEIGLVSPAERTDAGYRLYRHRDIERLQEVLFFREFGIGLHEIRRIMDDPAYERESALRNQRESLLAKSKRLLAMIETIDRAVEAERKEINMTAEEMLNVFDDFDPIEHQTESQQRWGDTDAYAESRRRVGGYTTQDWLQLKSEAEALDLQLLDFMASGIAPNSVEAMDLAEEHRAHITKWFYDCTPEIHAGLGQMYVSDSRFTDKIDTAGEGLALYLSKAIAANHERL